jgi:hypothetical protein
MSFVGVTGAVSNVSNASQPGTTAKTAPGPTDTAIGAMLKEDTVKLSLTAQATLMHRQGQSLKLIAANLGTSVATINGCLGIMVAVQPPAEPVESKTSEVEPTQAAQQPRRGPTAGI